MKRFLQKQLKNIGLQINKYPKGDLKRKIHFLNYYNINKVIDIGANIGQYAMNLREIGFKNQIISFEPLSSAFIELENNAKYDKNWTANNFAIGNINGTKIINVSENLVSSSINKMLDSHINAAPYSTYIGEEEIIVKELDSIFHDYIEDDDNIWLKIDTQGYEKNVLDGAKEILDKVIIVQIEMSITPLYQEEVLLSEMIDYLKNLNFELIGLENGFHHPKSMHLLQVDGYFINKNKT